MGQIKVRACQVCFVGGSLRKIGDEFMVPEDQPLRTGKMPPVMERVDGDDEPKPKPAKKSGRFKKKAAAEAPPPDED